MLKKRFHSLLVVLCIATTLPILAQTKVGAALSQIRPSKYSGPLPAGEFRNQQVELPRDAERRIVRETRYKGTYPEVRDPVELNPNGPPEDGVAVISDYAGPVNPLPASWAAAVVIGTVLDGKAFVSDDRTYVYSDFHVRIDEVLKQDDPINLAAGGQLVASRGGGTIRFPSGRVRHYVNQGEGMPTVGSRYLLFLGRPNISEPEYEVIIGAIYEIKNGKVHPLDDISTQMDNTNEQDFVGKVRDAIKASSGGKP